MQIIPQLSVRRGREAIAFYRSAFGAEVEFQVGGTDDEPAVVAQLSAGGGVFWVADESPEHANFSPETVGGGTVKLLLLADDPDAAVERATAAGAELVYAPEDQHAWRLGRVADPFGHHWEIGRPLGEWPPAR
jgi:PhnB protein